MAVTAGKSVKTIEEGLAHLRKFANRDDTGGHVGYDYSILIDNGGKLEVHDRVNLPCYGELRPYAKGSASNGPYEPELMPEEQRKVHKPGDLYYPFPKGNPIAVAVPFISNVPDSDDWDNIMTDVVLNPELSPWRKALTGYEVIRNKKNRVAGIVITDTKINPTIMVNMFRNIHRKITYCIPLYKTFIEKFKLQKLEAFILANMGMLNSGQFSFVQDEDYQMFGPKPNFKRILNGDPIDRTNGTFFDRYAYDRPKQDHQWNDMPQGSPTLMKNVKEALKKKDAYFSLTEKDFPVIVDEFVKLVR